MSTLNECRLCSLLARAPATDCRMTTGAVDGLVGVELVLLDELEQVLLVSVELESDDEFESVDRIGIAGATRDDFVDGALIQIYNFIKFVKSRKI